MNLACASSVSYLSYLLQLSGCDEPKKRFLCPNDVDFWCGKLKATGSILGCDQGPFFSNLFLKLRRQENLKWQIIFYME